MTQSLSEHLVRVFQNSTYIHASTCHGLIVIIITLLGGIKASICLSC